MIMTNNPEFYEKLMLFRSHGITRDPNLLIRDEGPWYYEQKFLGYNYRITDIQCALGINQMKKIDRFLTKRRELADRYNEAFENNDNIIIPYQLQGTNSGWHLYLIQVKNNNRRKVFEELRDKGIGVNVHYIPVYRHPFYQKIGYANTYCPNAEEVYQHILSLPLYPGLTEKDQDYVIEKVIETVEKR